MGSDNSPTWAGVFSGKEMRPQRVIVIAEVGKNFIQTPDDRPVDEYLQNAKALVECAKSAGADAVKFQTHNCEDEHLDLVITSPHFKSVDRFTWIRRVTAATPFDRFWLPLKKHCDDLGIIFLSTPMSRGAAEILKRLDPPFWKVGSGDLLDFVLLDYLASTGKPLLLSSGMATVAEIDKAVAFLKRRSVAFALLHCVSRYPCPLEDVYLGTIGELRRRYRVPIGFSDHTLGVEASLKAAGLGAEIIEKHFSLARDAWGPDHRISAVPDEFRALVRGIRKMEADQLARKSHVGSARGPEESQGRTLQAEEGVLRPVFRKALVAGQEIPAATVLTPAMLYAMRPQGFIVGLPSERYEDVVGRRTRRRLKKYDPIVEDVVTW